MLKWIKKLFTKDKWPKVIRFEVHGEERVLLDWHVANINCWSEIMTVGSQFAQKVLRQHDELDEVSWSYEELN